MEGDAAVFSTADVTDSGVDRTSNVTLQTENTIANVIQSIGAAGGAYAAIHGTKGYIEVPMFLSPSEFTVFSPNGDKKIYKYKNSKEKRPIGYAYEILHFADCLRSGKYDSELIPTSETVAVASEMEQARKQCGVYLSGEVSRQ